MERIVRHQNDSLPFVPGEQLIVQSEPAERPCSEQKLSASYLLNRARYPCHAFSLRTFSSSPESRANQSFTNPLTPVIDGNNISLVLPIKTGLTAWDLRGYYECY